MQNFYLANAGVMPLYAAGKNTGLVVDSGDGVTCVSPVYEGFILANAI